ncbi:aspartate--tRNA(Asn) ligase [Chloroflexi bacterium TSY]|nr:aspartate--tRNA(Asn) ligase [Chloroflexi bacterium TSY]
MQVQTTLQTEHRVRTTEIAQHIGKQVQLKGWLQSIRRLGGINFLILRDGWGTVQAVTEEEQDLAPLQSVNGHTECQPETVIYLEGVVVESNQAPGGFELHQPRIEVVAPVDEPLPVLISKREVKANLPNLLDHAVTVNRHPQRRAIFRLASVVMAAFRDYLNRQHFTEIQSPKIVASATESGANVFELDYFGSPAYLAQSPQFYKQIMVGVFERVYEVGPVFRAEPHDTVRHVNEYVSLDVEFGFVENHFTVLSMLRNVLAHIFGALEECCEADLRLVNAAVPTMPEVVPHIHFSEAKELIHQLYSSEKGYVDERSEPDLSPQEERWLGEWALAEHGSDFLAVTGYPMKKRPFYTYVDPERTDYSYSFDLLFRGTELVTGGQRLHLYQDYLAVLKAANLSTEPFESYLEAFRYGMLPHGGFAIGLERLLMQLLKFPNLRLTTLFPRNMNRLTP